MFDSSVFSAQRTSISASVVTQGVGGYIKKKVQQEITAAGCRISILSDSRFITHARGLGGNEVEGSEKARKDNGRNAVNESSKQCYILT